jgi:hypothetical protein
MREHFGEFKVYDYDNELDEPIVIDRINMLIFSFGDYLINVKQISDLSVCHNGEIIVNLALFDVNLYNAYINDYKINTIIEKGFYTNPITSFENKEYSTTYKNYRFKYYSGSRSDNNYIYVLEPIKRQPLPRHEVTTELRGFLR